MNGRQEGDALRVGRRDFLCGLGAAAVGSFLPPPQVDTLFQLPHFLLRETEPESSVDLDKLFGSRRVIGGVRSVCPDRFLVEGSSGGVQFIDVYDGSNNRLEGFGSETARLSNGVLSPDGSTVVFFRHSDREAGSEGIPFSTDLVIYDFARGRRVNVPVTVDESTRNDPSSWYIDWLDDKSLIVIPPRALDDSGYKRLDICFLNTDDIFRGGIDLAVKPKMDGSGRSWEIGTNDEVFVRDRKGTKLILEFGDNSGNFWEFDVEGGEFKRPDGALFEVLERERFADGNVIRVEDGDYFLLVNGEKCSIPDFDRYRKNTGFKGRVIEVSDDVGNSFRTLEAPSGSFVFDVTGDLKRVNSNGGIKIELSGGWLTEGVMENEKGPVSHSTFSAIVEGLKPLGFDKLDVLYSLYDRYYLKRLTGYDWHDTTEDPAFAADVLSFITKRRERLYPLDKRVKGGHSLGGLLELVDSIKNPEGVKAVFTLNSPLLGIPENWLTNPAAVWAAKRILGDKVVDFLLKINKNKEYRIRLNEGIRYLKSLGIPVYTFGSVDDLVVPVETSVLPESSNVIDGERIELAFSAGRKAGNLFLGHGEPLDFDLIKGRYIPGIVGENPVRKEA
ncbi:hypothetical protein C4577_06775 [Candidatus Parcubacteria bacterium]|nr:MAG: hypothetical protein C4577_06775 [Candidatus Parcubacteria bacterium]